jgi:hypothetical protein
MLFARDHRETDFSNAADDLRRDVWTTGDIAQVLAELLLSSVRPDEAGLDGYPGHSHKPPTPTLSKVDPTGIRFDNLGYGELGCQGGGGACE